MEDKKLLLGFPSAGLVGAFAVSVIVDKTDMKSYRDLDFTQSSPMYLIERGKVRGPIRIYKKDNYYAVILNIPLNQSLGQELADKILEFCDSEGISQIIIPRGIETVQDGSIPDKPLGLIIGSSKKGSVKDYNLEEFKHGTLFGAEASLVYKLKNKKISTLFIFTRTGKQLPDTDGITKSIHTISKILNLSLKIDDIAKKLEEIKMEQEQLIEQQKQALQNQESGSMSIYR